MVFSEYAPYDYTLESSRSPHGPISAYTTLKTLGAEGFTKILANTQMHIYISKIALVIKITWLSVTSKKV